MTEPLRVAVIGLSDEGLAIARGLAEAGVHTVGFDVRPPANSPVPLAESIADAVAEATLVCAVNLPNASLRVAEQVAPHLGADALYVDFNTGIPAFKQKLANVFAEGVFVDAAVLGSLDADGLAADIVLAGPSASRAAELLSAAGMTVTAISTDVGAAAARLLTRSILSKAIAGVIVDYMWAADAMGLSEWAYDEMLREFDGMTAETAKRLLIETVSNPKRREIEMLDIVEMLESVDYHSVFVPPTQLIYNKVYHSIKVPFGTEAEQLKHDAGSQPPASEW